MISAKRGFALSASHVLRTSDGGSHWTIMRSFRAIPNAGYALAAFNLKARAAIGALGPNGSQMLFTNNDGQVWRLSHLSFGLASERITPSGSAMTFIDPRHGWLVTFGGPAAGQGSNRVYRTSDGGAKWMAVANTFGTKGHAGSAPNCTCLDGISFRSRRVGWLTGTSDLVAGFVFYRSDSGGRRWTPQPLTLPPGFTANVNMATAPPVLFGRKGVLPTYLSSPRAFVLYRTHDAGNTWTPTTPIRLAGSWESQPQVDSFILGPNRVWSWVGRTLYGTDDGGRRWNKLAQSLSLSRVPQFQFLNPTLGFAISGAKGAAFALKGTDGGRIWHRFPTLVTR